MNITARHAHPLFRTARVGFLAVFAVWSLFPLYWIVQMSVKPPVDSLAVPPVFVFRPVFDAYRDAFLQVPIYTLLRHSLVVSFATTAVAVVLGVLAGYALTKLRATRSHHLEFWILSTRMAPPVAVAIPLYLTYQSVDLLDTLVGLVLVDTLLVIGIVTWILIETFDGLPGELLEAAKVDGCDSWTAFRRVMLPLARPGIAAAAVLSFMLTWNEFFFALILTNLDARTATVGVFNFIGFQSINLNALAAATTMLLVPALVIVLLCQRFLISGMTMGAVKG